VELVNLVDGGVESPMKQNLRHLPPAMEINTTPLGIRSHKREKHACKSTHVKSSGAEVHNTQKILI